MCLQKELLEKAKVQIGGLKELYNRLAEILGECAGQYYRWVWHFISPSNYGFTLVCMVGNCLYCCAVLLQVSWWLEERDTDRGFIACFHALVGNRKPTYALWSWGKTWVYVFFYSLFLLLWYYYSLFLVGVPVREGLFVTWAMHMTFHIFPSERNNWNCKDHIPICFYPRISHFQHNATLPMAAEGFCPYRISP